MGLGNFFRKLGDFCDEVNYSLTAYTSDEDMQKLCNPGNDIRFGVSDEMMDVIMEWSNFHNSNNKKISDIDNNDSLASIKSTENLLNNYSNNIIGFNSYKTKAKVKTRKNNSKDEK